MTALPLHERIRSDLEAAILDGRLPPGARLPVEHQVMLTYGCSRMTVSKAISALAAAGLVERRRRAGSFVARPRVHSMIVDIPDIGEEVRARGQAYAYRPIDRTTRAPANDDERRFSDGGRLLDLTGIHLADGVPLALEERLINLAAVPEVADVGFGPASPGAWLLEHVPWTEAETRICADNADARIARLLQLAPRSACLVVDRRTWRGAARITSVRQHFVGGAYDIVARLGGPQRRR